MPGFNQQGPAGQGPMTGRRMGRCTNYGAGQTAQAAPEPNIGPENMPEDFARGFGFGRGARGGRAGRGGRGFNGRGPGRGLGMQNRFRSRF
ncbi:MAG TPA: DUF5320 domain-containing protein [Perlabentimonas sp.]|nr:DUF5320 domain-containing protein [Bacteroidales bacterium]MDD4672937.1 DUF5320 domain-containing protein [Bacteroidales bacterium]MDY0348901.1 DUF5320 domain-containing protein [Tenuifilaceae bacterium]HZJ74169.1 DUF5320 domain-containing protein [Perlabentimonas sp.]